MSIVIMEADDLRDLLKESLAEELSNQLPPLLRESLKKSWLTTEESAELTGWSRRTLQHLRDSKQIPFSQHGRKIVYPTEGIERFLHDNEIRVRK